jgi:phospholipase/carboxylesterase
MDELAAILAPLLRAMETLGFTARHFHPPRLSMITSRFPPVEADLAAALPRLDALPDYLSGVATQMRQAGEASLKAMAALREGVEQGDNISLFRAMRHFPRAQAALYPLAGILPPVNRFFLEPSARDDEAIQKRFLRTGITPNTGVMHFNSAERGGFALYVPEDYSGATPLPLVMALHGGSGKGETFLWSWLHAARTRNAILVAPTSTGPTWAIQDEDHDSPNLARILGFVREQWNVDPARLLLTGMSDGGTFTYVSGLQEGSPFTHLAPISAAFHPMLIEMADADRVRGLPVHITHGALDWMFPTTMAQLAHDTLTSAGANAAYVQLDDLSHTYPREINAKLLEWMG